MADVGISFNADSFKAFNKTLVEFDKVSKAIDNKLDTMAKSLDGVFNATSKLSNSNTSGFKNITDFFKDITSVKISGSQLDGVVVLGENIQDFYHVTKNINFKNFKKNFDGMDEVFKGLAGFKITEIQLGNFITLGEVLQDFYHVTKEINIKTLKNVIGGFSGLFDDKFTKNIKTFRSVSKAIAEVAVPIYEFSKISLTDIDNFRVTFEKVLIMLAKNMSGEAPKRGWLFEKGKDDGGLFSFITNIEKVNISKLTGFSSSIVGLFHSLKMASELDLENANLEKSMLALEGLIKFFTKFSKATEAMGSVGALQTGKNKTGFGIKNFLLGIQEDKGIIGILGKFRGEELEGLNGFIKSLVSSMTLMKDLNAAPKIDGDKILDNVLVLRDVIDHFTGTKRGLFGKITGFFANLGNLRFKDAFATLTGKQGFLGIVEQLQKFGSMGNMNFEKFGRGLISFAKSLKTFSEIDIDRSKMNQIKFALTEMFELFTGNNGNIFQKLGRGMGDLIKGDFTKIFDNMIGRRSFLSQLGKFDPSIFANFGKLTAGMNEFATFAKKVSGLKINPDQMAEVTTALSRFMRTMTQGRGLFGGRISLGQGFLGSSIVNEINKIGEVKIGNFTKFISGVKDFIDSFTKINFIGGGDEAAIQKFISNLNKLTKGIKDNEKESRGLKLNFIKTIADAFADAIPKTPNIKKASGKLGLSVQDGFKVDFSAEMKDASRKAIETAEEEFEVRSPSRVMMRLGVNVAKGLASGMQSGMKFLFDSVKNYVQGITGIITKSFSMLGMGDGLLGNMRRNITFTFGDLIRTAKEFGEKFYRSILGNGIEFQNQFSAILKTLNTDEIFATAGQEGVNAFTRELELGIRDMATNSASLLSGLEGGQERLVGIAAAAAQMGIANEDILKFTETIGQLSVATDLIDEDAAFTLSRFTAITGTQNFEQIGSSLVALGNNFAATESEIAGFAMRIAGASTNAGLTEANMLALSASMAAVGLNAEAGGTAFTQILNTMTLATAGFGDEVEVGVEQMTNSIRAGLSDVEAERIRVLRNVEGAQDRLNRATTTSSRNSALNSLESNQAALAALDAQIASAEGRIESFAGMTTVTLGGTVTQNLTRMAEIAGMTMGEFSQSFTNEPVAAIEEFLRGLGQLNNADQLAALDALGLDSIRTSDLLRRLSGGVEILGEAVDVSNQNFNEAGDSIETYNALQQEAYNRTLTVKNSLNRLTNTFRDISITVSQFFLPAFGRAVDMVQEMAYAFNQWMLANPERASAILKVIGVAIAGVGASLLVAMGAFATFTNLLGLPFILVIQGAIAVVTGLVGILLNPFSLLGALIIVTPMILVLGGAIFGLIAVFKEVKNNAEGVGDSFVRLWESIQTLGNAILELTRSGATLISNLFGRQTDYTTPFEPLQYILGKISNLIDNISNKAMSLSNTFNVLNGLFSGNTAMPQQSTPENEARTNALLERRHNLLQQMQEQQNTAQEGFLEYTFQAGDTLDQLARDNGMTVEELLTFNGTTLEDYMGNVSTIRIPAEIEIDDAQARITAQLLATELSRVDEQLQNINNTGFLPQGIEDNTFFQTLFGEGQGGLDRAYGFIFDIRVQAQQLRTAFGGVVDAIGTMLSGDFTTGFDDLKTSLRDVAGSAGELFGSFFDLFAGKMDGSAEQTFDETGILPEKDSFKDRIEEIFNFDVDEVAQFLSDNLMSVVSLGMALAFGSPLTLAFSIGGLVLDAIGDDFMGMGSLAEDSPIIAGLVNLRQTIQQAMSDIFSSIGQSRDLPSPMQMMGDVPMNEDLGSVFGASIADMSVAIGELLATVLRGAVVILPSLIGGFATFAFENVALPLLIGIATSIVDDIQAGNLAGALETFLGLAFGILVAGNTIAALVGGSGLGVALVKGIGTSISTAVVAPIMTALTGLWTTIGTTLAAGGAAAIAGVIFAGITIGAVIAAWLEERGAGDDFRSLVGRLMGLEEGEDVTTVIVQFFEGIPAEIQRLFEGAGNTIGSFFNDLFGRLEIGIIDLKLSILGLINSIQPAADLLGTVTGFNVDDEITRLTGDRFMVNFQSNLDNAVATLNSQALTDIISGAIEAGVDPTLIQAQIDEATNTIANAGVSERLQAALLGDSEGGLNTNLIGNLIEQANTENIDLSGLNISQRLIDEVNRQMESGQAVAPNLLDLIGFTVNENSELFTDEQRETMVNMLRENLSTMFNPDELGTMDTAGGGVIADNWLQMGNDIITGLQDGITENQEGLNETIVGMGEQATEAARTIFATHSPSEVFKDIGFDLISGLDLGIKENMPMLDLSFNYLISRIELVAQTATNLATTWELAFLRMNIALGKELPLFSEKMLIISNTILKFAKAVGEAAGLVSYLGVAIGTINPPPDGTPVGVGGISGGKEFGGSVKAGNMYEILENNLPFEVFEARGRTFMLSNADGYMHSPRNSEMTNSIQPSNSGGGFSITINAPVSLEAIGNIENINTEQLSTLIGNKIEKKIMDNQKNNGLNDKLRNNGIL